MKTFYLVVSVNEKDEEYVVYGAWTSEADALKDAQTYLVDEPEETFAIVKSTLAVRNVAKAEPTT